MGFFGLSKEERYDKAMETGKEYSKKKEYEKAVEEFSKAIALKESDGAYHLRGSAYSDLKEYDKAIEDYTKAIELEKGDDFVTYYNRGLAHKKKEDWDATVEDFTKCIEIRTKKGKEIKHDNDFYHRGIAYYKLKEYDKAMEDFRKRVSKLSGQEECVDNYHYLGLCYLEKKIYNKMAISIFDVYIRNSTEYKRDISADDYYNLGFVLLFAKEEKEGEYKTRAIENFTKAIELRKKEKHEDYFYRGACYKEIKNYKAAVNDFTKCMEIRANTEGGKFPWPNDFHNRGEAYYKLKEYDKAIEDFSKAIELRGDAYDYYWRGRSYHNKKDYDAAIEDFTKCMEIEAKNSVKPKSQNFFYRGQAYFGLEKYDQAIEDFTKAIELKPSNGDYYNWRSEAYKKIGNEDAAKKDDEKVFEMEMEKHRAAIKQDYRAIDKVPLKFATEELCLSVIRESTNPNILSWIPKGARTEKVCLEALVKSIRAAKHVPEELLDATAQKLGYASGYEMKAKANAEEAAKEEKKKEEERREKEEERRKEEESERERREQERHEEEMAAMERQTAASSAAAAAAQRAASASKAAQGKSISRVQQVCGFPIVFGVYDENGHKIFEKTGKQLMGYTNSTVSILVGNLGDVVTYDVKGHEISTSRLPRPRL